MTYSTLKECLLYLNEIFYLDDIVYVDIRLLYLNDIFYFILDDIFYLIWNCFTLMKFSTLMNRYTVIERTVLLR